MTDELELEQNGGAPMRPRENRMGTAPVTRLILSMSWPAMLSMLIQALYNIVDSAFVARISEDALTALTLVFPVQMLLVAVGVGTGIGINSLVSRRLGARRYEEASQAASAGIKLAVISWIFFALIGGFLSGPIVQLFSDDPVICRMGVQYLTIVFVFSISSMVQMILEKTIQSVGNMVWPMISSICGCVTNIILDPILIFGLLGAPKLGVIGAAIATIIGQTVSVLISLYVVTHKVHDIHIDMHAKLDKYTVGEIYAVGIPSILMQTVISIANALMNLILVGLSTTAVAVMGVYGRLQSFIFMPVFGLNQGTTPIFGFNYGAGNKERLVKALKTAWVMAFCIMLCGFILFQTVPEVLLGFFDASPQMLEIGVHAFRIISICFLPASIGIIGGSMFAATGHGVISLVSAVVRQLVFIVPSAFILSRIGGLDMVWWAFPISEIFGLAYVLIMLKWLFKHDINKLRRFDDIDSGIL